MFMYDYVHVWQATAAVPLPGAPAPSCLGACGGGTEARGTYGKAHIRSQIHENTPPPPHTHTHTHTCVCVNTRQPTCTHRCDVAAQHGELVSVARHQPAAVQQHVHGLRVGGCESMCDEFMSMQVVLKKRKRKKQRRKKDRKYWCSLKFAQSLPPSTLPASPAT